MSWSRFIIDHQSSQVFKWPTKSLVEGVGASSPPGQEQAESDGLEHSGHGANGNGIEGTLLGEDLADELLVVGKEVSSLSKTEGGKSNCRQKTYTRSGASEEDQCSKVRSALVAQSACGVDQSSHTVGLDGTSNQGATPCGSGTGSLLGLDELLL